MKRKPEIQVISRLEAYKYCKSCHNMPAVIISIFTPDTEYPYEVFKSDTNGIVDILDLSFADVGGQESINSASFTAKSIIFLFVVTRRNEYLRIDSMN